MHTGRATLLSLALLPALAGATDIVTMKSGDRLSGSIVDLQGEVLTLETTYAGKVPIKWAEVAAIETGGTAKFKLRDGTVLEAQARPAAGDAVVLQSGEIITTAPIALADVAWINPPPEVTGEGVSLNGRANLGLTANRGNTDNSALFYDVETIARGADNRFTIGALGEQKEEDGEETARRNRAYLKYDHFFTDKWYSYANGDFEEDKFKDLNLRSTLGVGAGYQFFESKERNLSLEGGLTYVNDDYDLAEDDSYAAGRWALRFDQFLFGSTTQFFHLNEGLVSVEDPDDFSWRAQTGLRFPLVEQLNATLQYNVDWRNNPPPGTEDTDSSYIMSVGYAW
jgi:putative salt-induced outer membrane protein YdiY